MPLDNSVTVTRRTSGNYVGNAGANRAIPHKMPATPKFVLIMDDAGTNAICMVMQGITGILWSGDHTVSPELLATTVMDSTNFYVGNATSWPHSANLTDRSYYWTALG